MTRTRRTVLLAAAAALVATGAAFAVREIGRSEAAFLDLHAQAPATMGADFLHAGHGHAGVSALLGKRDVAGIVLEAAQIGALRGNVLGTFEFSADRLPAGAELTAWIGTHNAPRTAAAQPVAVRTTSSTAHAHLELPAVVTAQTKLWVAITTPNGAREVVSFELAE